MPPKRILPWKIPDSLLQDANLNATVQSCLSPNYNFEIHKTIWRIRCLRAKRIALQMPEGLLIFATAIANILKTFSYPRDGSVTSQDVDIVILGDVTYGACCVDDYTAQALDVDLLVHYGHSCLVPVESISVLYVFVDIQIDVAHFVDTIKANFDKSARLALVSTIQFVTSLQAAKPELEHLGYSILIPQVHPLSPGEILGCTSPKIDDSVGKFIYLGDGRFHLESMMIANPHLEAYRYDPYDKSITREHYDHEEMRRRRKAAIDSASQAQTFGIILGTLGRQGSPPVVRTLQNQIEKLGKKYVIILLSEIFPSKLALFDRHIDVWIQVACPRLSIDWGTKFSKPILNPYEAAVALGLAAWKPDQMESYPMDFYANNSLGPWTPNHAQNRPTLNQSCSKFPKSNSSSTSEALGASMTTPVPSTPNIDTKTCTNCKCEQ